MPALDDEGVMGPGYQSQLKVSVTEYGPRVTSCHCTGPQGDQPYCPCRMKALGVIKRNGRYVIPERDCGPIKTNE